MIVSFINYQLLLIITDKDISIYLYILVRGYNAYFIRFHNFLLLNAQFHFQTLHKNTHFPTMTLLLALMDI